MDGYLKSNLDKLREKILKDWDFCIIVDGTERAGKCQPRGSKVLIANGSWKNIEDIKIGDEVISPQPDGTTIFAKVKNTTSWYSNNNYNIMRNHKQHNQLLYKCTHNHLIPINKLNKKKEKIIKNYTAEEYSKISYPSRIRQTSSMSPLIKKFKDRKNCLIEPYSLGAFLGDGSYTYKEYTEINEKFFYDDPWEKKGSIKKKMIHKKSNQYLTITSADKEILDEIKKYYPTSSEYKKKGGIAIDYRFSVMGEFAKLLKAYNLHGKTAGTKFIPKDALYSDSEYRKKLLAGLIDTDGCYSNGYEITLKSEQLIDDIKFLIHSLGGKTTKTIKKVFFNNVNNIYYRLHFNLGELKIPTKCKRKINKSKKKKVNKVSITPIKSNESFQVYGFEIDSPSKLYITDNWMVTHNSLLAQQCAIYVDPTMTLDRVCMTGKEFLLAIDKAEKGQAVILDEAYKDLDSAQSQKKMQGVLKHAMAEMGQKNLFVFIVLPSYFELARYAAIHRSIALLHVYTGRDLERGFFTFYGKKKKQRMYMRGKRWMSYCEKADFYGRFSSKYVLDEREYREKKSNALKFFGEEFSIGDLDDIGKEKEFKWNKSLGAAFRILGDLKFTKTDIYRLLHIHEDGQNRKMVNKWIFQSEKYEEEKYKGLVDYKTKIKEQRDKIQMVKRVYCSKCGGKIATPQCANCYKEKFKPPSHSMVETAKTKLKDNLPITPKEAQRLLVSGITVSPKEDYAEYQRQYRVLRKMKTKIKKEFEKQKNIPNLKMAGGYEKEDKEEDKEDEKKILKETGYDS